MNRLLILPLVVVILVATGCASAMLTGTATGDREYPTAMDDSRITQEVRSLLYRDPWLADERIYVSTSQRVVTLRGSVENRANVSRALNIARSVEDVRGVNIELQARAHP